MLAIRNACVVMEQRRERRCANVSRMRVYVNCGARRAQWELLPSCVPSLSCPVGSVRFSEPTDAVSTEGAITGTMSIARQA